MASWNHLLKCCILLAILTIVQAQTNRKLLDNNTPTTYSHFKHPPMDSRQDYLPSSHRSLGAQYYKRSPPPPPPRKI
ncbi:PREDICTED: uncharacterized protein LOC106305516 [Brassica oleracea var. oleracea]|uniref:Extensin domain-containing protein n=1 Tax=Brassica oleracea var. oleracea TaxID=109376 RepID=A0A0D3DD49_BRAOL|nr:PREDICTED: uncharacterized protein LOC106305516 [Brassica oleracea var. oleracea]